MILLGKIIFLAGCLLALIKTVKKKIKERERLWFEVIKLAEDKYSVRVCIRNIFGVRYRYAAYAYVSTLTDGMGLRNFVTRESKKSIHFKTIKQAMEIAEGCAKHYQKKPTIYPDAGDVVFSTSPKTPEASEFDLVKGSALIRRLQEADAVGNDVTPILEEMKQLHAVEKIKVY